MMLVEIGFITSLESGQRIYNALADDEEIQKIFKLTQKLVPETDNCVYMGGVALNCVANSIIARDYYPKLWILPNPGDAGSSLGCAAYVGGQHIDFDSAFLGYDIKGKYPVKPVLKELLKGNLVGVANGRAEYGPRALGNRSLLADPVSYTHLRAHET